MKKISNHLHPRDSQQYIYKHQHKRRKNFQKNLQALEKYTTYMSERRKSFLKDKLKDYYGKNFVIDYQNRFNFEEEWQDEPGKNKNVDYFIQEDILEIASAIIIILVLSTTIWLSTIDLFLRSQPRTDIYNALYAAAIFVLIAELVLKIKKEITLRKSQLSLVFWVKKSYKQVFCITCYCLKISLVDQKTDVFWIIFEVIALYFQYNRASNLYRSLRLMRYSLHYEYHSKICDLLITLFIILHSVAIVLYLSTLMGFEQTWLNSLNIDVSKEFVVYLYAFYFGSTTVLTVGYGDISPKNPGEIVVTCFVEIVGIVTFAFIINEIGYSIGNLRKGQQIMEKDLSVIEKMRKHYKISDKLHSKARSFIVNSKHNFQQLYPAEEKTLLLKFNEQLRHNFSKEAALSVVKSSIFFLTRWSKSFCLTMTAKIEHIFISPNDPLYQPHSKERIYIIKKGKINIYAEKGGRKKGHNNLLKTIEMDGGIEVADNCYGTTAVMSMRPVRLYAIAKDNTSAYYIDKSQFQECISQRVSDFEYYHELKSKIDGSDIWEGFQAPMIRSSKHHYNPTKRTVLCRYLATINTQKSSRSFKISRCNRRQRLIVICDDEFIRKIRRSIISRLAKKNKDKATMINLITTKEMSEQMNLSQDSSIKPVENQAVEDTKKLLSIGEFVNTSDVMENFESEFQVGKQFTNYFPLRNVNHILQKYQNQNFSSKFTNEPLLITKQFRSRLFKRK